MNIIKILSKLNERPVLLPVLITLLLTCSTVWAENIDPGDTGAQYAWGENTGWLNSEPSGDNSPGVQVEDSKLTGYIWSENIGWISLSCENTNSCKTVDYGIINDGKGNLSGYAWSENTGWISFSCSNKSSCGTVDYKVVINPYTGIFSGDAWGENIGWISFDYSGSHTYGIKTSWQNDMDNDGITDTIEDGAGSCTFSDDADTDDDGIPDGVEDKNQNGIVDAGETDPCLADSDNDGIQDGTETGLILTDIGSDTDTEVFIPDADPYTTTDPLDDDTDNDGHNDGEEDINFNGRVDEGETDPNPRSKALPAINLLLLGE